MSAAPRFALFALLALLLPIATACSAPPLAEGDCAVPDPEYPEHRYQRADCADPAALRVLTIEEDVTEGCYDVPGVTRSVFEEQWNGLVFVCLGPQDVDPATAPNVAEAGDCFADDGAATETRMRRVDCAAPDARYRVLAVDDGADLPGVSRNECVDVAGATTPYSFSLQGDERPLGGLVHRRLFCLAPVS